ncbi:sensor histidine kinase [Actinoalloteichus hymeniacidonis]|uniref:Histidine kinase n=1 Tax=Actinoalloteichus hymeniacidonis TaxID=340345 RepID=A0AAC9HPA5_9PSEU|nr:histidine kinase [Actinoalloteichus hymeniacidonis]AOS62828.1 histidine kinase [Actinoalloteichus hymeniacidonis]MBB5909140.1 signal transduction histidine kinase [Actinoalloteichus hymeniacidonis]
MSAMPSPPSPEEFAADRCDHCTEQPSDHALVEAVLAVASGMSLEPTLRRILRSALSLLGARFGAFIAVERGRAADSVFLGLDASQWHERISRESAADPEDTDADVLTVAVGVRDEVYGRLSVAGRSSTPFGPRDRELLTGLASTAGIAVADARLLEQEQDRRRWSAVESEITTALIAGVCAEDAFGLLARRTLETTSADLALVFLAESDGSTLRRVGSAGAITTPTTSRVDRAVLLPTGQPGAIGPQVLDAAAIASDAGLNDMTDTGSIGSAVALPLGGVVDPLGAILVARVDRREPMPDSRIAAMAAFADQISLTLQLVERQRTRRQLDLLADRDRIARELHDQVIQRLFAIGLALDGTADRNTDPVVDERIHEVLDALDATVREIRTSIFDLHAETGAVGLRRRLLDTVSELTVDTALSPVVRISGTLDSRVSGILAGHAEAVLREAVSNVVRHAGATRLTVTIEVADQLVIDVLDDGVGVPTSVARSGLRNLAERAAEADGTLTILAATPRGTRLSWRAPVRPEVPQDHRSTGAV